MGNDNRRPLSLVTAAGTGAWDLEPFRQVLLYLGALTDLYFFWVLVQRSVWWIWQLKRGSPQGACAVGYKIIYHFTHAVGDHPCDLSRGGRSSIRTIGRGLLDFEKNVPDMTGSN